MFGLGLLYWGNRFTNTAPDDDHLLRDPRRRPCWSGPGSSSTTPRACRWSCRSAAAVFAGLGLFVLAGATPAALGLLADISERFPNDRGAIMGLYSVFLAVGQIIGALIGGFAAEAAGIDGMLIATMALLIVALAPARPGCGAARTSWAR